MNPRLWILEVLPTEFPTTKRTLPVVSDFTRRNLCAQSIFTAKMLSLWPHVARDANGFNKWSRGIAFRFVKKMYPGVRKINFIGYWGFTVTAVMTVTDIYWYLLIFEDYWYISYTDHWYISVLIFTDITDIYIYWYFYWYWYLQLRIPVWIFNMIYLTYIVRPGSRKEAWFHAPKDTVHTSRFPADLLNYS